MMNLTFNDINMFRDYIKTSGNTDFAVDLSNMNIFESLKFIVLSSEYYYQKFPKNKLKCIVNSDDLLSLISGFSVNNLEILRN